MSYKGLIRYLETNNLLAEFLSASLFQILEKLQANLCFLFIIWYKFQSSSWQNFSSWRLLINVHKPLGTNFIASTSIVHVIWVGQVSPNFLRRKNARILTSKKMLRISGDSLILVSPSWYILSFSHFYHFHQNFDQNWKNFYFKVYLFFLYQKSSTQNWNFKQKKTVV